MTRVARTERMCLWIRGPEFFRIEVLHEADSKRRVDVQ